MFRFPATLYPIVDTLGDPRHTHVTLAHAILDAGAPLLQLRVKRAPTRQCVDIARAVQRLAAARGARLIINDRADVAKLVDAAGVHLGQTDLPPAAARGLLGPDKIIGFSTHSVAQAVAAAHDGYADYLGFGPLYPTTSKEGTDAVQGTEGLRAARAAVALPLVAIGGITTVTMADVLAAGADAVAMIGEIVRAPDVAAKVRELLNA